ncbi:hypothetical protein MRX96_028849 [Rhipicephalus microplus]
MGSSSPSTVMMETPLPGTGGCFLTAEKKGYVTWSMPPQQKSWNMAWAPWDKPDWKDTLFATKAPSVHSNRSRRSIAAQLDRWATYASAAEKCSGEVSATPEELAMTLRKVTRRRREMWPCHPLPAGREPAPLWRCPSGQHGSSQQRRLPRFSRLFLSGRSERVAGFGDPHVEQCVAVGDSRSYSCVAEDSRVFQQKHQHLQ